MAREIDRLTVEGCAGEQAPMIEKITIMLKMVRMNRLNNFLWYCIDLLYHSHCDLTVGESLTKDYKILINLISHKWGKDKTIAIISCMAQIRKVPGFRDGFQQ